MTSEQPDKYTFYKIENNQIATFKKKFRVFANLIQTVLGDNILCKSKLKLPICSENIG